jgi:hypothetical protein
MTKHSTNGARASKKAGGKKRPAKKEAAERALIEAQVEEFKTKTQPLFTAIEESMSIMADTLRSGDNNLRDAATQFLICASNRFDAIPAMKGLHHETYGYEREHVDIAERLKRLTSRKLPGDHQRLDHILSALVKEARELAQSQTTFCEQCEHCLRENPTKRDYEMTTEESVDEKTWAYIVERFSDISGNEGTPEIVAALKHIASMVWVSRPGAVRDRTNELVAALFKGSLNETELSDDFAKEQLATVRKWSKDND